VLVPIQSARRHIKKRCVRFVEVMNRKKAMSTANGATQMMQELLQQSNIKTPPPQYALVDLNSLYSLTEKLTCPWCHNKIRVQRVSKNQLVFTLRVYCVECPFEVHQKSSPLVKAPSRKRRQPDIQLRLATAAQIAGLKYAQFSQFLDLLGVNPPAETAWQGVSDIVFDSVEKITIKSMQNARETARTDNDLWVIIDCRWASRGHNSEQATVLVMDGNQDKVLR